MRATDFSAVVLDFCIAEVGIASFPSRKMEKDLDIRLALPCFQLALRESNGKSLRGSMPRQ